VSDDLKTWRMKLRPGIKFHDGTPFDAAAVIANLDRTSNPANRCRCLTTMSVFKEWKAIDPMTVEITLKVPNAAMPTILADAPGIMVSPTAFKADPQGVGLKPVGTGPFKFVEWVRNSRFVVERNPDYWQKGKPYLDRVVFRGMQNIETREAAFKSGQTDIIMQPTLHFVSTMKNDRRHDVYSPAGFGTEGIYMNLTKPPLDDMRVRRAVAHAMDRELINRTLGFGVSTLAYSPFGKGMSTIQQPVADYPKFDLPKAQALVKEYGKPVEFSSATTTRRRPAISRSRCRRCGRRPASRCSSRRSTRTVWCRTCRASSSRPRSTASRAGRIRTSTRSRSSIPSSRPINPSQNYGGYISKRVDELLEQGMATGDPAKRAAIYSEFARVLNKEVLPYAYLFNVTDTIVTKKHVKGLTVVPDGLVRFADMYRQ
jgi:peptide/nickel transport system substrate-binding protein